MAEAEAKLSDGVMNCQQRLIWEQNVSGWMKDRTGENTAVIQRWSSEILA